MQRFTDEPDDDRKEDFRTKLTQYVRLYAAITQMIRLADPELERLYSFGRLLRARLPRREDGGAIDLDDDVRLEYYRLQRTSEGDVSLGPGDQRPLTGVTEVGASRAKDPATTTLSEIIGAVNQRFSFEFSEVKIRHFSANLVLIFNSWQRGSI